MLAKARLIKIQTALSFWIFYHRNEFIIGMGSKSCVADPLLSSRAARPLMRLGPPDLFFVEYEVDTQRQAGLDLDSWNVSHMGRFCGVGYVHDGHTLFDIWLLQELVFAAGYPPQGMLAEDRDARGHLVMKGSSSFPFSHLTPY